MYDTLLWEHEGGYDLIDDMQPQQHNFDFILNPQQAQQTPQTNFSGGGAPSIGKRILVVAVLAVLLIIIVVVFFSFIGSGSKADTADLTTVAADQAVLSDIGQQAGQKGTAQSVKDLGYNTSLSILTSHTQLLSLVKTEGTTLDTKQANALNASIDSTLTNALGSGTFDSSFIQILQQQLQKYRSDIAKSYSETSLKKRQQLFVSMNQQAILLQTEQQNTVPGTP